MKKIGRYIIRGLLGRGGMGRVYKVEMPVTGKIAALKLLRPNEHLVRLMGMDNIRELFVREAVTMANLRHSHLLEIWDYDEDDGLPFYTMSYHCNNLGDMIGENYALDRPSRRIRMEKAIRYVRQILEGLACLHYAGIIHRDIKPFNILISDEDTVKICDFGLSKLRGETFRGPANLKVGTPWYASPEQAEDPDNVDFSADLFSVGVMLYRMLTGRLPMDDPRPPSTFDPDLEPAWDRLILKAIDEKPERRFHQAGSMLAVLAEAYAGWRRRQESVCRLESAAKRETGENEGEEKIDFGARRFEKLRSRPMKVSFKNARQTFGLDDLFRPENDLAGDFVVEGPDVVTDRASGLLWERSGSPYSMTWHQASGYIDGLNRRSFSSRTSWRLPTVAELMTLLITRPPGRDLCLPSIFGETQRWLWSCDKNSYISSWYVDLDLGFIGRQDHTAYYYVKAVCDLASSSSRTAERR